VKGEVVDVRGAVRRLEAGVVIDATCEPLVPGGDEVMRVQRLDERRRLGDPAIEGG
jgi:hypothetical protein